MLSSDLFCVPYVSDPPLWSRWKTAEAHSPWLSISLPPCASTATKSGSPQSAIRNSRLQPCPDSLVRLFPGCLPSHLHTFTHQGRCSISEERNARKDAR